MSLWLFCFSSWSFCIFVVVLCLFLVPPVLETLLDTVFPHYMVVLFKETALKKLRADNKMKKEKGQRPAQCVCVSLSVCVFSGECYCSVTTVCSNRKWAVSLNLLPWWSWFTEIRPVILLLNQSNICCLFFFFFFFFLFFLSIDTYGSSKMLLVTNSFTFSQ